MVNKSAMAALSPLLHAGICSNGARSGGRIWSDDRQRQSVLAQVRRWHLLLEHASFRSDVPLGLDYTSYVQLSMSMLIWQTLPVLADCLTPYDAKLHLVSFAGNEALHPCCQTEHLHWVAQSLQA